MFKETFERPSGEEKIEKLPEEERIRLIEEEEKRLQKLMDRAAKTVEMAALNKFISEADAEKLYNFLERVNEEISSADEDSADTNETLARLKNIEERLKLPGDLGKDDVLGKIAEQEKFGDDSKLTLKKFEELMAASEKQGNDHSRKSTGLFGMKNRARKNSRDTNNRPDLGA